MKIIKECWQLVCKWFENALIRNTIILSTIFALVIHVLFSITAPCNFLEGEWGAGDILTYVSTIALGVLAVWQNQRFKEENDIAQERLERISREANEISIQANELSIIAKIAEIDGDYLDNLESAFNEYFAATNTDTLTSLLTKATCNKVYDFDPQLTRINSAYKSLLGAIASGYHIKDYHPNAIIERINTFTKDIIHFLTPYEYIHDGFSENIFVQMGSELYTEYSALEELAATYLAARRKILCAILFENISLKEIREIYDASGEDDNK